MQPETERLLQLAARWLIHELKARDRERQERNWHKRTEESLESVRRKGYRV